MLYYVLSKSDPKVEVRRMALLKDGHFAAIVRFPQRIGSDFDLVHDTISASLQFPGYYGRNLNALHDCLSDMSWNMGKSVHVFIENVHLLIPAQCAIILEYFARAVREGCDAFGFDGPKRAVSVTLFVPENWLGQLHRLAGSAKGVKVAHRG